MRASGFSVRSGTRFRGAIVANEHVCDDDELAHDRDERDLGRLGLGAEAIADTPLGSRVSAMFSVRTVPYVLGPDANKGRTPSNALLTKYIVCFHILGLDFTLIALRG